MKTGLPPLHGDDLTFGNIRNIDVRRSGGQCRCVGAHLGDQRPGRETSAHSAHRDVRDAEKAFASVPLLSCSLPSCPRTLPFCRYCCLIECRQVKRAALGASKLP